MTIKSWAYQYTDQDGDRLVISEQQNGDMNVVVTGPVVTMSAAERPAAAEALAGPDWRVIPADIRHIHALTADPDEPCAVCGQKVPQWERELLAYDPPTGRPEPVDEGYIRSGDRIELTLTGTVDRVEDGVIFLCADDGTRTSIAGDYGGSRWRILGRAEPEPPHPAHVEVLGASVHTALAAVGPPKEHEDWRTWSGRLAYLLAREGVTP